MFHLFCFTQKSKTTTTTTTMMSKTHFPLLFLTLILFAGVVHPFTLKTNSIPQHHSYEYRQTSSASKSSSSPFSSPFSLASLDLDHEERRRLSKTQIISLNANSDSDSDSDSSASASASFPLSSSDQTVVGATGIIMSFIMLYSEFVLKSTGCGLPAGPFGLVGAVEGLSYLGVTGLVSFSVYTKVTTGKGLPAGNYGLLGAAEGLGFLAILAGIIVLVLQVTNFGYIPNAVPMEGGMCQ